MVLFGVWDCVLQLLLTGRYSYIPFGHWQQYGGQYVDDLSKASKKWRKWNHFKPVRYKVCLNCVYSIVGSNSDLQCTTKHTANSIGRQRTECTVVSSSWSGSFTHDEKRPFSSSDGLWRFEILGLWLWLLKVLVDSECFWTKHGLRWQRGWSEDGKFLYRCNTHRVGVRALLLLWLFLVREWKEYFLARSDNFSCFLVFDNNVIIAFCIGSFEDRRGWSGASYLQGLG